MKMRNFLMALTASSFLALTACGSGSSEQSSTSSDKETVKTQDAKKVKEKTEESLTYTVVPEKTELAWKGRKVYQEDYSHNGLVPVSQGELYVKGGELTGGNFTADLSRISDHDLKGAPEDSTKLVGHLKSDDFFHVKKHPNAKFEITSIKPYKGEKDASHIISGNLTLRGKTKNIEFPATVQMKDDMIMATANFTIDRTRWGVTYGAESTFEELTDKLKDKVIANDINLNVDLAAKKKAMASN